MAHLYTIIVFSWICATAHSQLIASWSSWSNCSNSQSNCISRTLNCRIDGEVESLCRHGNTSVMEELYNCSSCNGSWISNEIIQSCLPTCYNSSRLEMSVCSTDISCIRRTHTPCNDLSLCAGSWENSTSCNATCGSSGVETSVSHCIKNSKPSIECSGTFGITTKIITSRTCTNEECSTWSEWIVSECSRSCGGGSRNKTRTCTDSLNCTNPKVSENVLEACNTHECPSWTTWSSSGACYNNVQAWSRVCVYKNVLHTDCNGGNQSYLQTILDKCNSTIIGPITDMLQLDCDQKLYTVTIPLSIGLALTFFLILIIVFFVLRRKYKQNTLVISDIRPLREPVVSNNRDHTPYCPNNTTNMFATMQVNSYQVPIKDEDPENGIQSGNSSSKTTVDSDENEEIVNYGNTTFHRYKSFPGINDEVINEEKSDVIESDQFKFKPRPSVRRAEQLKMREERRGRKMIKKRGNEDSTWQWTQTLHMPSPKLSDLHQNNAIEPTGHRRTHSAGDILDFDLMEKEASSTDNELTYTETSITLSPPTNKPIKPRRHSVMTSQENHQTTIPVILRQDSQTNDKLDTLAVKISNRERALSENDLTSSATFDQFQKPVKPMRSNSARRNVASAKRSESIDSISYRPAKPKRNPSFKGRSFDYGSSSPHLLHPVSMSLHERRSSYSSMRSLHSLDELSPLE